MGLPGSTPTEDDLSEETTNHPTEDDTRPPRAPGSPHEQADPGAAGDRSSFVTIGGGLIALSLLAYYASPRSKQNRTNRQAHPLG